MMFRPGLAADKGMLFILPEEGIYSFWMKNMHFPLDIIWIGKDKKVADITANVPLCKQDCESYVPGGNIKYVAEVNAGFADRNRIKIGDRVSF